MGFKISMTVYCKRCGEPPLNYITINDKALCIKCANEEYQIELKKLQSKYCACVDFENPEEIEKEKKILEWYKLVNIGLVNGLSFTARDERLDELSFWRKRSMLFNAFSICVQDLFTGQDYSYAENDLKNISEEGWKKC